MFCPQCGAANNDAAKFCFKCGAPLAPAVAPPIAPAADPRMRGAAIPATPTLARPQAILFW